jgi:N4-gp56 family major capsid protein
MSYTTFGVNDANAVKLWSKFLAKAERDSLDIAPLMGDDDNAIIHVKEETEKGSGDKVTFSLRGRPTGAGFTESETAEGNGEALSFYADAIYINELGHNIGARSENTIDAQRVPFDLRQQCKNALADWWKDRKSLSFFNQVCGYTPANTSGVKYTGMNAVTAPAGTGRHIWAGSASTDQGLTSSDIFTLDLVDSAVEAARTGNTMVRTVNIGGQKKYVQYLSEGQVKAMRANAANGQWMDITKFTYSGVDVSKNPIYSGALGEYNGVILRRSQDVTRGVQSAAPATAVATVRRSVLLGAQAACAAFGLKAGPNKYRWNEELLDHKRNLEVSAWSIWGLKKAVFNSTDHGVVVVSTYSAT